MFRLFNLLAILLVAEMAHAATAPLPVSERPRGSKFEWARLRTSGVYWNRHADGDPKLISYIRRSTSLNVEAAMYPVRATSVEDLSVYPFIYCDNIGYLTPEESKNLGEYLRRGGFLFIDACRNSTINPSVPKFLSDQLRVLKSEFPDLRTEEAPPSHEIFSIYFKMTQFPPYHTRPPPRPGFPLLLVYAGDRLISVIGRNGFQCAWASSSDEDLGRRCAQMVANIYVYAITR
jgi:hypothetical protein